MDKRGIEVRYKDLLFNSIAHCTGGTSECSGRERKKRERKKGKKGV
jgi:hypothetical protein